MNLYISPELSSFFSEILEEEIDGRTALKATSHPPARFFRVIAERIPDLPHPFRYEASFQEFVQLGIEEKGLHEWQGIELTFARAESEDECLRIGLASIADEIGGVMR